MQLVVSWSAADPDAPACDPYWNYVQLLMHGDGADNGVVFTDSSAVGRTVTRVNSAVTSTTHKKFGTASLLVGPADGYLQMLPTGFEWWNNDFTIECFVRYVSLSGAGYLDGGTRLPCLIGLGDPSSSTNAWSFGAVDDGTLKFYYFNGSQQSVASASGLISAEVWYHIAMTKSGSTVRLFLDGAQVASATVSGGGAYGVGALILGRINNNSANAYIDELRITKGIARYTANFTPPTEPFAEVECGPADPFFANLVLLAPMEGSNGSSYFVDLTARHTLVPVSASVSTSGPSFPAGALSVSGTTSYLRVEGNEADWKTSGELTVECFAAHTSFATGENFLVGNYGGSAGGWQLYITGAAGAGTEVVLRNGDALVVARTIALSTGVKRHYAFCRAGNTGRLFVDGVQVGASFDLTGVTLGRTGTLVHIGVGAGYPTYPTLFETSGYIGWVRVTSAARYTADFTVPSTPFPAH